MNKFDITSANDTIHRMNISVFDYDAYKYNERDITLNECINYKDTTNVKWINIKGVKDREAIDKIGQCYGISPLAIDKITDNKQRPKLEDYGSYYLIILKMLTYKEDVHEMVSQQVSFILGSSYVISFMEDMIDGDVFEPVRKRIRTAGTRIRISGPDYLVYRLIDSIIDNYFSIIENLGDDIEKVEEETVTKPDRGTLIDMQKIRKEMLSLRKAMWPVREVLNSMQRAESGLIKPETRVFLRDLYDHTVQFIESVETYRDMMSSLLDIYLSSISNKLNEIMKVLTILSTIFMPLTFIVGLYGMNFHYMPELGWRYGYLMIWAIMMAIVALMLYIFRKRDWI